MVLKFETVLTDAKSLNRRTAGNMTLTRLIINLRRLLLNHIRDLNRERVLNRSQGAGGTSLEGYSTNPLYIRTKGRIKRIVKPVGGIGNKNGMYFSGGYKDYRSKAGLISERFVFSNIGDAWRDWKVLSYGSNSTPGTIGFTKPENAMAANAAIDKRPLLFHIDKQELSVIDAEILRSINDLLFPS